MFRFPEGGPKAMLFDFDGVILDSARLKSQAFARCYAGEHEERIAAVVEYQDRHGGIGRREKFRYFEREIFGRSGDERAVDMLCRRFGDVIDAAMLEAPFIAGAEQALLALHARMPLHIVSGMPEIELKALLSRRSLDHLFASVAGSPTAKKAAFERILREGRHAPADVLAVGDSTTEFEAARMLGIPFLAIVADSTLDFFPPDVPRLPDLSDFLPLVSG